LAGAATGAGAATAAGVSVLVDFLEADFTAALILLDSEELLADMERGMLTGYCCSGRVKFGAKPRKVAGVA
jgi:hypothetical protein